VNDVSVIPWSENWDADHELPNSDFGFVWDCHWATTRPGNNPAPEDGGEEGENNV